MDLMSKIRELLKKEGVPAALRFLNARTPHRFTGIYRYDGTILRNVYLYDAYNPAQENGDDVNMEDAYCANVGRQGAGIEFNDIHASKTIALKKNSAVVSYCGALIRDSENNPWGTLCHFDIKPCQTTDKDLNVLEKVAPVIYEALLEKGYPRLAGPIE